MPSTHRIARIRRWSYRGCLATAILLIVLECASVGWWSLWGVLGGRCTFEFGSGLVGLSWESPLQPGSRSDGLLLFKTGEKFVWWPAQGIYVASPSYVICYELLVPLWLPGLVAGAAAIALRLLASPITGHCVKCRYDLRATPPGRPCPECGHTPHPPKPA